MGGFRHRLLFLYFLSPSASPSVASPSCFHSPCPASPEGTGSVARQVQHPRAPVPACPWRPAGGGPRLLRPRPRPRPRGPRCSGGAGGRVQPGPHRAQRRRPHCTRSQLRGPPSPPSALPLGRPHLLPYLSGERRRAASSPARHSCPAAAAPPPRE